MIPYEDWETLKAECEKALAAYDVLPPRLREAIANAAHDFNAVQIAELFYARRATEDQIIFAMKDFERRQGLR